MQKDGTLRGHWYVVSGKTTKSCNQSHFGTSRWGPLNMTFNRADLTFTGLFSYCGGNYERKWNGQMIWSQKRGHLRQ